MARRPALLLVLAAFLTPLAGSAWAGALEVDIDQAARLTLPAPARDVMIGNPAIADVSVMDARHVMVLGKAYGTTNLMITGASGRPIFNRQVVVGSPSADHVTLYRGPAATHYACAPRCELQSGGAAASSSPPSP